MTPDKKVEPAPLVPPFVRFVASAIPMVFDDSLSYYECLAALTKYMQDVADVVNNNGAVTEEYIQLTKDLKEYMDNYFENLDVQAEINNKLDQMADSGELGELMSAYILPIQQAYEARVDAKVNEQDLDIAAIEAKVDSATNGSPLPASSLDDMTDTDRIYVLVSSGKWYYYDGDSWEIGGDYQAPVAQYDTTLTVKNGVADSKSIGARINKNFYVKNLVDYTDIQSGKKYDENTGEIINSDAGVIFNSIIEVENGDVIHCEYNDNGTIIAKNFGDAVEVDAYGNFVSFIGHVDTPRYTATRHCFIRLVSFFVDDLTPDNIIVYKNMISSDPLDSAYIDKNTEEIERINDDIDLNSTQYNYLDTSKCILNQNLDGNATVIYINNTFFVTNPVKVKNGDIVRFYNFSGVSGIYALQVLTFDTNKRFLARSTVNNNTFTATADGYVMFNCVKPTNLNELGNIDITVNREIGSHYPYGRIFSHSEDKRVRVQKVSNNEFTIYFGDFNMTLFKTVDVGSNSNNWNLKVIKRGDNVLVPAGTDFIGPVRINANTDFIGGVHGDETTTSIILNLDGIIYKNDDIQNISDAKCNKLSITLISDIYDQLAGDLAFTRNVVIDITDNKMHCSNSYKAKKNLTLKTACVGGLIACQNPIIKNITLNTVYYDTAPNTSQANQSKYNNIAVIDTNYGSIQVNNIKGYTEPNYIGFMHVYTNETPMRCKVYFDTYYEGNFPISTNDIISGEFEYLFN